MTKNLFIIYDKAQKKCAETLYNLLSNNQEIKASIYTQKEAPKLVSRAYVLYLGEKCSSELNAFKDTYNETGIHIGTMGTKAWIRCEEYNWDENSVKHFVSNLISYGNRCQMNIKIPFEILNAIQPVIAIPLVDEKKLKRISLAFVRESHYLLGTLMFYKDYLDKFLGINQNKEANQELTPDEKKK